MSLASTALPAEMRACLSLVGDHIECRCGVVFEPRASFLECRDHARKCTAPLRSPKPTEAPAPDNARQALEEFKRMERIARVERFQKTWGGWRNGGWYERLRSRRAE